MDNLLVLGDSHAKCFTYLERRRSNTHVEIITGASCQGLTNWNSKLNARQILIQALLENKDKKQVILFFGEVDCNATIWVYKDLYNTGLQNQLNRSIENYKKFISEVIFSFYKPEDVYILAPILPVTENQLSIVRKDIYVSKKSRTALTNLFCKKLERVCNDLSCNFYTVNDLLVGENGLIKDTVPHRYNDHHINKKFLFSLWRKKLPI